MIFTQLNKEDMYRLYDDLCELQGDDEPLHNSCDISLRMTRTFGPIAPPTVEDIEKIIKKLKNLKIIHPGTE